jgi:hypothetical protein
MPAGQALTDVHGVVLVDQQFAEEVSAVLADQFPFCFLVVEVLEPPAGRVELQAIKRGLKPAVCRVGDKVRAWFRDDPAGGEMIRRIPQRGHIRMEDRPGMLRAHLPAAHDLVRHGPTVAIHDDQPGRLIRGHGELARDAVLALPGQRIEHEDTGHVRAAEAEPFTAGLIMRPCPALRTSLCGLLRHSSRNRGGLAGTRQRTLCQLTGGIPMTHVNWSVTWLMTLALTATAYGQSDSSDTVGSSTDSSQSTTTGAGSASTSLASTLKQQVRHEIASLADQQIHNFFAQLRSSLRMTATTGSSTDPLALFESMLANLVDAALKQEPGSSP